MSAAASSTRHLAFVHPPRKQSQLSVRWRFLTAFVGLALSVTIATSVAGSQTDVKTQTPVTSSEDNDAPPPTRSLKPDSQSTDIETAWSLLNSAAVNARHPELRIQALAALGAIGSNLRAHQLITDAMKDVDVDVRTGAVLAAGQSKDRTFATQLRLLLDDHEPQVAVAAASTLWKMNDRSGEDILIAVADGERRSCAGLLDFTRHTVANDLHNPSMLARIGALQGASMLLGPFGFGITAYEYLHRNGGDSARTLAIELLSHERTETIHKEMINALKDKDLGVRAAAATALGDYHDQATRDALADLLYDPRPPVRLTAAAAYLRSTGAVVSPAMAVKSSRKRS